MRPEVADLEVKLSNRGSGAEGRKIVFVSLTPMIMKRLHIPLSLVLLLTGILSAFDASAQQTTKIRGRVTDADTGEPIAIVGITVPGTTIGTTTDLNGIYAIEIRQNITEISAILLGYETQSKPVTPGAFNSIDFKLKEMPTDIGMVVIKRGEDPAYGVLRKVYAHKRYNNPDEKDTYSYRSYSKIELDIAGMRPEFKSKRMQRNFGFVFQYMDTSAITGRAYLPAMITESQADYYYQKSPKLGREVIHASRMSGIDEDFNLAQFTAALYAKVNLYENYINIFEVNFASPLSEHGSLFYKFYLVDSTSIEGRKTYKIRFHPRGQGTPVFDGEVNIDSATWGLRSANMRTPKGINLNWIRDLVIETSHERLGDSVWFPVQDKLLIDFSIILRDSTKLESIMGTRQVDYSNVKINEPTPPAILAQSTTTVMDPNTVIKNDEQYWEEVRPYELTEKEKNIYVMVDSIKEAPLFKTIYSTIETVLFGYYKPHRFPYLEFGPYYKLVSFNDLEGARFQIGTRTTKSFSERVRLSGFFGASTKDGKMIGGGSVEYMFKKFPFRKLTVAAKHDFVQLGASDNAFSTANIMSSIFSRGGNEQLTEINQYDIAYEHEWAPNFSNAVAFQYRQLFPTRYVAFLRPDSTNFGRLYASEFKLGARLSRNEIIIRRAFSKNASASEWPVLSLDLTAGLKNVFNSHYEYYRMDLGIDHTFNIAPIGRSTIKLRGGKIFGKVPFPLLKLHEGNSTYFYDRDAFSCMDFYEFASDLWGQATWEHHFRGFFLGKIPLMKKLQWREVITVKALWGKLSDKNNGSLPPAEMQARMLFPDGMTSVSKPYVEAGFGIENIFRFMRLDFMWRITHRDRHDGRDVDNFSVNFSMHFNF